MLKQINIVINGYDFTLEVGYSFTKGRPAKLYALPENCYPEDPDEWIIESASIVSDDGALDNIDFLIEALEEDIIEALEEKLVDDE